MYLSNQVSRNYELHNFNEDLFLPESLKTERLKSNENSKKEYLLMYISFGVIEQTSFKSGTKREGKTCLSVKR